MLQGKATHVKWATPIKSDRFKKYTKLGGWEKEIGLGGVEEDGEYIQKLFYEILNYLIKNLTHSPKRNHTVAFIHII